MRVSEIRVKRIRVNQGLGVIFIDGSSLPLCLMCMLIRTFIMKEWLIPNIMES